LYCRSPTPVDWFSDKTYIPFGRIEDLEVELAGDHLAVDSLINAFKNLRILQVLTFAVYRRTFLLHRGAEAPCRSLWEIWYTYSETPGLLIRQERKLDIIWVCMFHPNPTKVE